MRSIKFRRFLTIAAVSMAGLLIAFSCDKAGTDDSDDPTKNLPKLVVTISGTISHTTYTTGQSGTVSFNRFPATVPEFKQVRDQIGGEPHGAIALQVMAYELFRRDRVRGEECIRLNNVLTNVTTPLSQLKQLFSNDANYARPYQMAAYLKGATWDNGYKPDKPYTVEVEVNNGVPYEESSIFQSKVLHLKILTQGKPSSDMVSVLKTIKPGEPGEGKYFIVFGSGPMFSQVREISFSTPFQGLD
jgi:D-methionine transport system substrate-binding protein